VRPFPFLLAASVLTVCTGCGPRAPLPPHPAFLLRPQLTDAGAIPPAALGLWARTPTRDFRQEIRISIRDDVSSRGFEGRGALAVRPGHALRMILLGPGGTTAMDVWIRDGRFRVSIPALDRRVRGDGSTPKEKLRGMPIALLSRWLVAPFGGALVAAHAGRVDDSGAVVDDPTPGPAATNSFVAFLKRGEMFEVRSRTVRDDRIEARAWWLEHGRIQAFLVGRERALGQNEDSPVVPIDAHYVSFDPPMTVEVHADSVALVDTPLPEATFADPDAE
jgi:hypothetical protein